MKLTKQEQLELLDGCSELVWNHLHEFPQLNNVITKLFQVKVQLRADIDRENAEAEWLSRHYA